MMKSLIEIMIPEMQKFNVRKFKLESLIQEAVNKKGSTLTQEENQKLIEKYVQDRDK